MAWQQIICEVSKEQSALYEEELEKLGALSVTVSDAADQPLFEPLPGETPLWDSVQLVGLFDINTEADPILNQLEQLGDSGHIRAKIEILQDRNWTREWMDQYKPTLFGKRLWIYPSWHQPPQDDGTYLILDPGMAFGTGTHPTTALCLEWLDSADLLDRNIIDFGCGSGVLAVASLLLGASKGHAIDIDPQALLVTRQNAEKNRLTADQLEVGLPDALKPPRADVLLANILAGPLSQLAPLFASLVVRGGHLVLSGILNTQQEDTLTHYQDHFELQSSANKDEWVCLVLIKN